MEIREYRETDLQEMTEIWNAVVAEKVYFPQERGLSAEESRAFFAEQSRTGVAVQGGEILGLYILHPNNIGRCGHIANASYAVKAGQRGKRIGEALVRDSMVQAKALGFRILQFNAVVAENTGAIRLYEKLGFAKLGTIPGGFRNDDGIYSDIIPFYIALTG